MAEQTTKSPAPAYISYKSFTRFINGLRDGHLPSRIDRSMLTGMSGSAQSSLLGSLEFLGLIDSSGEPQRSLEELVELSGAQYNAKLKELLTTSYPFLFEELDLKRATTSQVHEAFRRKGLQGSTAVKAIAFFLSAAKEAGIEVSKHVKAPTIVRSSGQRRTPRSAPSRTSDADDDDSHQNNGGSSGFSPDVHPALAGILLQLPPSGVALSLKERERFMNAFEAVLNLVYPTDDGED